MSISQDLAELNHVRFQQWVKPLEVSENIIPAIFAFNGEVYKGFDVLSLNEKELLYAQESVFILSGLFISTKFIKKSSNLSGSAKLYFISSNVAEILLSLNNLIIFS